MKKQIVAGIMSFVMALSMVAVGFAFFDIDSEAKTYSSRTGNGIAASVVNPGESLNPFTDEDAEYIWKGYYEEGYASNPDWCPLGVRGFSDYDNTGKQETIKYGSIINIDWEKSGFSKEDIEEVLISVYEPWRTYGIDENGDQMYTDDKNSQLGGGQGWDANTVASWDGSSRKIAEKYETDEITNWVKSDQFNGFHVGDRKWGAYEGFTLRGNDIFTIYIKHRNSDGVSQVDAIKLLYANTDNPGEYIFNFKDNDGTNNEDISNNDTILPTEQNVNSEVTPDPTINDIIRDIYSLIKGQIFPPSVEPVDKDVVIKGISNITDESVINEFVDVIRIPLNIYYAATGKHIKINKVYLFDLNAAGSGRISVYVGKEYAGCSSLVTHYKNGRWSQQSCIVQDDGRIYPSFASFSPIGVVVTDQADFINYITTSEPMKVTAPKTGDNFVFDIDLINKFIKTMMSVIRKV